MPSKTITFLTHRRLPQDGGAIEARFSFSILDTALIGTPDEQTETTYHTIFVRMPHTLQVVWNLQLPQLDKVMYEYARYYLSKMLGEGQQQFSEMLDLYTSTTPLKCPYDPDSISMTPGESHVVIVKG